MKINPYERGEFEGLGARYGGRQDPRKAKARNVLPPGDNPLSLALKVGWFLLNRRCWPESSYMNVFFVYYLSRAQRRIWDVFLGIGFWLLLVGAEVTFLLLVPSAAGLTEEETWASLFLLEVFFLPPLLGVAFTELILSRVRSITSKLNFEEIMLTPLPGEDIVRSIAVRPAAIYTLGLAINSLTIAALFFEKLVVHRGLTIAPTTLFLFALGLVLILRFYLLKTVVSHASACALRAGLMYRDGTAARLRAFRDFLLPGATAGGVILGVLLGATLATFLACIAACFIVGIVPIGLAFLGGVLEERAVQILDWLGRRKQYWAPVADYDDDPLVPSTFWAKWNMKKEQPRAVVHPMLR